MTIKPLHIFFLLCFLFAIYTVSIYIYKPNALTENKNASEGRLIWQKYNCQACHQLYGLGGYLGPDLTNLTSTKGKDESYIRAMIRTGTRQMPAFDLNEEEEIKLIDFLKSTDQSGIADPRQYTICASGMIEGK